MRHRLIVLLCCLSGLFAQAQDLIYLEHANTLVFDEDVNKDYQKLIGDVRFRHDSAWLYCDTAHFFRESNSLYAYGHVHMTQGDTLTLDGKTLYYDGNRKLAMLRTNVVMTNKDVNLYTDNLNYDRAANVGYFFQGGKIVDPTNTLASSYGSYNPAIDKAFFKDSVTLTHPDFVMYTDTLNYNTETRTASIVSHTRIVGDSAVVHAFRGWYNTNSGESELYDRSYVLSTPYYMIGDTVSYDQSRDKGWARSHVQLMDSSKAMMLTSNYAYYDKASETSFLTGKALLKEFSQEGDTLYLHADTLMMRKDSIYDNFLAYHHVRIYRSDLQAVCDSMFYSSRDSILDINGQPIIWSDNQQVRGNHMKLFLINNTVDHLHVERNASVVSQEPSDTSYYNQSSGDDLKAYFLNNKVNRVTIEGNARSIYIPHNEDDEMIGMVSLEQGDIEMFMDSTGQMSSIKVAPQPKGRFFPLSLVKPEDKHIPLFSWPIELRPTGPEDVFRRTDLKDDRFEETRKKGSTVKRSNRNRRTNR